MLLALERRRIAHPKAQDYVDFQNEITAGIFGGRNGLQHSLCGAEDRKAGCLHWVRSGHRDRAVKCPLLSQ